MQTVGPTRGPTCSQAPSVKRLAAPPTLQYAVASTANAFTKVVWSYIEAMAGDEETYDQVYTFLSKHQYPADFDKNQKCGLRRKAKSYKVECGVLLYRSDRAPIEERPGGRFLTLVERGIAYWKLAIPFLKV